MTRYIIKHFIIVLLISLVITSSITFVLFSFKQVDNTKERLIYDVQLIDYALNNKKDFNKQIDKLSPLSSINNSRISVIDKQGKVIADTYGIHQGKDHLSREEVKEALKSKDHTGFAIRNSSTINEREMYAAYYDGQYIVRLSIPYNGIGIFLPLMIPSLALSFTIAFIVAVIIARLLAKRISQPLTEISESLNNMTDDYRFSVHKYPHEEYNNIVATIEKLSHRLRKSMRETQFEQNKIDLIIRRMNEGFILLDEKKRVLSINKSAKKIVGPLHEKDDFKDIKLEALRDALHSPEEKIRVKLKLNNRYYKCYVSKFPFGTALFFVDITAAKNAEKMREDFFSSVSHELKTPITSIRGYSELLSEGVVTDPSLQHDMLEKIQKQVDNMSNLINDILLLSRFDNDDIVVERVPVNMKSTVEDIVSSYESLCLKEEITIHKEVEDVNIMFHPQQMANLLSNLISNAIKYNHPGGLVNVNVYKNEDDLFIEVSDTGIGIPQEDQNRVFERFYRVDKGRSRMKGGTGLGLAIVKHIVSFNKGKLTLTSTPEVGTTITIRFPNI